MQGRLENVNVFGISNRRSDGFINLYDLGRCGEEPNELNSFALGQSKALKKSGP